jgi:hypothetical protein
MIAQATLPVVELDHMIGTQIELPKNLVIAANYKAGGRTGHGFQETLM